MTSLSLIIPVEMAGRIPQILGKIDFSTHGHLTVAPQRLYDMKGSAR